jgi:hypothetical protein
LKFAAQLQPNRELETVVGGQNDKILITWCVIEQDVVDKAMNYFIVH